MNIAGGPGSENFANAVGVAAAMTWVVPGGIALLAITFMIVDLLCRTPRAIRAQMSLTAARAESDEPLTAPFPTSWPGKAAESAPVAPLKVAHLASTERRIFASVTPQGVLAAQ
jgi:hypothetical protein